MVPLPLPDTCTGTVSNGANIDTSSTGSKTFKVDAKDKAGNAATQKTATYTIVYDFGGFKDPVDPQPTYNTMKAGLVVPLRFSLGGDQGTSVLAKRPEFVVGTCPSSGATFDAIEKTVSASSASGDQPTYNKKLNEYVYNWATRTDYGGKCGELVLTLKDGKQYKANFKFSSK